MQFLDTNVVVQQILFGILTFDGAAFVSVTTKVTVKARFG